MSFITKNTYAAGNTDLTNLMEVVDMQRLSFMSIEVDETNKQIEAGSVINVNGELGYTDVDTAIADTGETWASIGTEVFYVRAVGGATDEFQYSTVAPAYDQAKGGWYNGNERTIVKAYKTAAGAFAEYGIYGVDNDRDGAFLLHKIIEIGDWDMDASSSVTVAHGLGVPVQNIRHISCMIIPDVGAESDPLCRFEQVDGTVAGGINYALDTGNIGLRRMTGGVYDGVSWDATPYNRGYITIWYVV